MVSIELQFWAERREEPDMACPIDENFDSVILPFEQQVFIHCHDFVLSHAIMSNYEQRDGEVIQKGSIYGSGRTGASSSLV